METSAFDILSGRVEHWVADTTKMIFLAPGHFIDFSSRLGLRLCISLTLSMRLSYCHLVTPSPHCPPPSIEWNKYKPFSASQDPMFFVREVYHCFLVTITIDPCYSSTACKRPVISRTYDDRWWYVVFNEMARSEMTFYPFNNLNNTTHNLALLTLLKHKQTNNKYFSILPHTGTKFSILIASRSY